MPAEWNICNQVVRIKLLEKKAGEITLDKYLISSTEIISSSVNTNYGVLLFVSGYVLGIIWGR